LLRLRPVEVQARDATNHAEADSAICCCCLFYFFNWFVKI